MSKAISNSAAVFAIAAMFAAAPRQLEFQLPMQREMLSN